MNPDKIDLTGMVTITEGTFDTYLVDEANDPEYEHTRD